MNRHTTATFFAAALTSLALPVVAQTANTVVGEKIDSGLGSLPHYSQWAKPSAVKASTRPVAGESLDNQLGELPHYRLWVDRSGKDPMGTQTVAAMRYASAKSAARPTTAPGAGVVQASN